MRDDGGASAPDAAPAAALVPASPAVTLDTTDDGFSIRTGAYRLRLRDRRTALTRGPYLRLDTPDGRKWSDLSLLSSVHTAEHADETWQVDAVEAEPLADGTVLVRVQSRSTAWTRRELTLRCTADAIEIAVRVEGSGAITEATLLGGRAMLPSGAAGTFRSDIRFRSVLAPAATEPVQFARPASTSAVLGVVGDADPGRLSAVFSPPPLVFGLGREAPTSATEPPPGEWIGLGLRAPVDELTMTAYRYDALDGGFLLQLDYEGRTVVDGEWTSPTVVLRFAADGWRVLDDYRDDLEAAGHVPPGRTAPVPDWWHEPIFCGWGAQVARARHHLHGDAAPTEPIPAEDEDEEPAVVRAASSYARQDVYDELLARMAAHDVDPGTIVIDDRWQAEYGTGVVDTEAWPDLKGWIAAQHAEGRRVLLWWKAWDAEGLPAEECVRDPGGRPLTADAANPAYLARVARIMHELLGADGLDADGLKIDFTQRGPSGRYLAATPGTWGIAALHRLLAAIHDAAVAAKPDAMLIGHAVHPSFADVIDVVRLNDVSKYDAARVRVPVVEQLRLRHGIASRMLPRHPIDTDQWPMPSHDEWLAYVGEQHRLGIPALYYVESIDRSGEPVLGADLDEVARTWREYRAARRR